MAANSDFIYEVGKQGSGKFSKRDTLAAGRDLLGQRMSTIDPKYKIKEPGEDFSMERSKKDTLARITQIARAQNHAGLKLIIAGSKPRQPSFVFKITEQMLGSTVVKAALSQLGVDYVWADVNPEGPAGGPGAGFDCSGFVLWCYQQVDVQFPHMAEAIRQDPKVTHFGNRADLKPGDLIFYHFTNRVGVGAADHIAIAKSKDTQIAASSSHDAVVVQGIITSAVMHYGFVRDVTGKH